MRELILVLILRELIQVFITTTKEEKLLLLLLSGSLVIPHLARALTTHSVLFYDDDTTKMSDLVFVFDVRYLKNSEHKTS